MNRLAPRPPLRTLPLRRRLYKHGGSRWPLAVCLSVCFCSVCSCMYGTELAQVPLITVEGLTAFSLALHAPSSPLKSRLKLHQLSWLCCSSLAVADSGGDQWKASKRFRSRLGSSPPCPGTELQSGSAQLSWVTLSRTAADGCWNFSTCYVVGLMLREPPLGRCESGDSSA